MVPLLEEHDRDLQRKNEPFSGEPSFKNKPFALKTEKDTLQSPFSVNGEAPGGLVGIYID